MYTPPFNRADDEDELRRLVAEVRAGWLVTGPDAYVSPTWYAAKAEHGRVVPTWNYSAVHLTGTARIHDDPDWLRAAVTDLTTAHEGGREEPWQVTDAPAAYVEAQLRGIVGLELTVTAVEGKAKLSQNRSADDVQGVVAGLATSERPTERQVARQMAQQMAQQMAGLGPDRRRDEESVR